MNSSVVSNIFISLIGHIIIKFLAVIFVYIDNFSVSPLLINECTNGTYPFKSLKLFKVKRHKASFYSENETFD